MPHDLESWQQRQPTPSTAQCLHINDLHRSRQHVLVTQVNVVVMHADRCGLDAVVVRTPFVELAVADLRCEVPQHEPLIPEAHKLHASVCD